MTAGAMAVHLAQVECLSCGYKRSIRADDRTSAMQQCPRCEYVGWAESTQLTEQMRKLLRDRPPNRRRLHAV